MPPPKLEPQPVSIFAPAVPVNRDAKQRQQFDLRMLESFRTKQPPWSARERVLLEAVLKAQLQEDLLRRRLATTASESTEAKQAIFLEMCSELGKKDFHDMMEKDGHLVDWMTVAEKLRLAGEGAKPRSAVNCLIQHKHFIDRMVSHDDFTEEEDQSLRDIVARRGAFHWDEIAAELDTKRSAWQCFARYQSLLVTVEHKRTRGNKPEVWTPEQERRLSLAQQVYGSRDWTSVAKHVPGHSPAACRRRAGGGERLRKPWSKAEESRLILAAKRHGANWVQVAARTFGRPRGAVQRHFLRLVEKSNGKLVTGGKQLKRATRQFRLFGRRKTKQ